MKYFCFFPFRKTQYVFVIKGIIKEQLKEWKKQAQKKSATICTVNVCQEIIFSILT